MVTRAQLLKRNPIVIAARSLIADNAINPDRVDLDSLTVQAIGDKSVQIRAEIMVTVPLAAYQDAVADAQAEIEEERRLAGQAEHEKALAAEEKEYDATLPVAEDSDDGF